MGKYIGMKVTEEYEQLDSSSSSFEMNHPDLIDAREEIIAETVVFAFLQKQINSGFDNFLIPTIGISKEDILFYLYDPDHDILLESPPFNLFLKGSGKPCLSYAAVLALWLTINYPYFCTGITNLMKERGFTADFFPTWVMILVSDQSMKRAFNLENVVGRIVKTEGYYLPQDGELWEVEKGGVPVKEQ
ncbi:uncharacterized protein LOC132759485 [Ruditapes philippinarum]|uniref:uncharacterized protein LOC132759485 n=1 Tax=Ruditapes philippinarum TaxID=129788 RepID=UPI00295C088B|nr:uncharacterized protein LOC132759485 [Ruditapes philippinarum]